MYPVNEAMVTNSTLLNEYKMLQVRIHFKNMCTFLNFILLFSFRRLTY